MLGKYVAQNLTIHKRLIMITFHSSAVYDPPQVNEFPPLVKTTVFY